MLNLRSICLLLPACIVNLSNTSSENMPKRGYIVVYDARVDDMVEHKKKSVKVDRNPDKVFPLFDKVIQGRNADSCVPLSFLSALKAVRVKSEPDHQGVAWDEAEEAMKSFHEIACVGEGAIPYVHKVGYTNPHILRVIRNMTERFFAPHGLYLCMKSYRTWTHRTIMKMTATQRAGKVLVLFGMYPSTAKWAYLKKKLCEFLSDEHTANRVYDKMPKTYWTPMSEFTKHAITIIFDSEGRATIDDPAHPTYHALTVLDFFRSCACIYSVYELSVIPTDQAKKKKPRKVEVAPVDNVEPHV